jgi:hypothetical protein
MASTPLAVVREAYEINFGRAADATLPVEEMRNERQRRYTYEGRALVEAITNEEPIGWEEVQTLLSDTDVISHLTLFLHSSPPEHTIIWEAYEPTTEISRDPARSADEELHDRFAELSRKWHEETDILSSPADIFLNFNYQQIIGMGSAVLPLIMEEFRAHGGRWFWALRAITGTDPVPAAAYGNAKEIRQAWLDWWQQNA